MRRRFGVDWILLIDSGVHGRADACERLLSAHFDCEISRFVAFSPSETRRPNQDETALEPYVCAADFLRNTNLRRRNL